MIARSFEKSRAAGAERAVITGGGEPTLVGFEKLNKIVQISSEYFPGRVTLISNGLTLSTLNPTEILQRLLELDQSGLSVLAISRHHQNAQKNQFIMGIDTQTEKLIEVYSENKTKFKNLKMRLICVLQKSGVSSEKEVAEYIDWARNAGISEINFKELYVSSDRESLYALSPINTYSEQNRVFLRTVLNFADMQNWKKIYELPWGAPIFEKTIDGVRMQIAAYTEPSLFWERTNGVARSWNLMADGKLMMSLENGDTEISY
jgi:MoaA/NifB/PqqE/SkfB family radical SAM enzyme